MNVKILLLSLCALILLGCNDKEELDVPSIQNHGFTYLPLTEDGWTDIVGMYQDESLYTDCRIIYVSSSSGVDNTKTDYSPGDPDIGTNPFEPTGSVDAYKSIAAGYARLRDGYPDILLLKRGDTWNESVVWSKSGASAKERMIFGAYGPEENERPVIEAFSTLDAPSFYYNIVVSIEFAGTEEDVTAFSRRNGGGDFLVEDCAVLRNPNTGMTFTNGYGNPDPVNNIAIRRCVIAERYPTDLTGHTQGLFAAGINGFLIEENIFDHNGWTDDPALGNPATQHNHNTYLDVSVSGTIMRYNISTRASSHGYMPGGGGYIFGNVSYRDPIGISAARAELNNQDGERSEVRSNVVIEPFDTKSSLSTNWGISAGNISSGIIADNIISSFTSGTGGRLALRIIPDERYGALLWVRNLTIENNVLYNFGSQGLYFSGDRFENITVRDNRIHDILGVNYSDGTAIHIGEMNLSEITSSGNSFYSAQADGDFLRINQVWMTVDQWKTAMGDNTSKLEAMNSIPEHTIINYLSSYNSSITTLEQYYQRLQRQRKGNWDKQLTAIPYINYVRNSFGKDPIECSYQMPSTTVL